MVEQLTLDLAWLWNLPLLWFPLKLAGLRSLCKWAGVTTQSGLQILKVLQCSLYSRDILVFFILYSCSLYSQCCSLYSRWLFRGATTGLSPWKGSLHTIQTTELPETRLRRQKWKFCFFLTPSSLYVSDWSIKTTCYFLGVPWWPRG